MENISPPIVIAAEMEEFPLSRPKLMQLLMNALPDCDELTLRVTKESVGTYDSFGTLIGVKVNGTKCDGTEVVLNCVIKIPRAYQYEDDSFAEPGEFLHNLEAFTYQLLLPHFKMLQAKCAPFDAYPKAVGYSCRQRELGTKGVVLVENMIHQGYVMKNVKEPLDFNHLEMVVKTYAEFHATSMAMKLQGRYHFTSIIDLITSAFRDWVRCTYRDQQYLMTSRILNLLGGDQYAKHTELLKKLSRHLFQVIGGTLETCSCDCVLAVLCHGSSTLDNILFKYGDKTKPNVPTKVCLIDFQMLRYGSPIFDLSYFIFTATDKATRDEHYDQLIDIYYREVCMRLEQMGSPPAVVFPYDKFQLRLKRFSVLGYFMAQMALYTMLRAPSIKVTDQMTEAEIKESMERNIVESEALYDERIKGMLIDFVEKGYFDFLDEEYPDMEFDESTTDSTDDNMADEEDL